MKRTVAPDDFSPRPTAAGPRAGVFVFLAVAAVGLLAGCPGQLEGNFPPPGSSSGTGGSGTGSGGTMGGSGGSSVAACDAPNMVFKKTCLGAACHQGIFAPKLTADDPSSELIGKPAVQTDCMGMNLVEPNSNPPAGVLIKRITGGDCGDQMPLSATALTQEQINCVNSWLASKLSP